MEKPDRPAATSRPHNSDQIRTALTPPRIPGRWIEAEPADLSPVTVRVTHPFHPRFGQELEFVKRLMTWRVDRVFFFDEAGALGSLPAEWTDLAPPDVFVVVADGRVPFRTSALLELADSLAVLRAKGSAPSGEGVQEITP